MHAKIPFAKAQAVGNDFLIVEAAALDAAGYAEADLPGLARRMCHRRFGLGADGVELVLADAAAQARIRMFNPDGSEAEISGNGTRCVAAWLVAERGAPETLTVATAAGAKSLRLLGRDWNVFDFEMGMGAPVWREDEIDCALDAGGAEWRATIVAVGNPQCALFVEDFEFDWRALGRTIETLPRFPGRTNVSFVRALDRHTLEVRFWERGAGETASSGTGSTGAAAAAILSRRADSPVRVRTVAGDLELRWEGEEMFLRGPAAVVAQGVFLDAKP